MIYVQSHIGIVVLRNIVVIVKKLVVMSKRLSRDYHLSSGLMQFRHHEIKTDDVEGAHTLDNVRIQSSDVGG